MKPSEKQQKVLDYLEANGQITLGEAVMIIGRDYYCNERFHVGQVLSRMVKRGLIKRVSRGLFERSDEDKKQFNLFAI